MKNAATTLQEKIHHAIPLSEAMGYHIIELSSSNIIVEGPLEPNVNIHGTGFAGSIYSLATLSAWSLVTHVLAEQAIEAELVIVSADIKYLAPVKGAIQCQCQLSDKKIQSFIDELEIRKGARLEIEVSVGQLPEARLNVVLLASFSN